MKKKKGKFGMKKKVECKLKIQKKEKSNSIQSKSQIKDKKEKNEKNNAPNKFKINDEDGNERLFPFHLL